MARSKQINFILLACLVSRACPRIVAPCCLRYIRLLSVKVQQRILRLRDVQSRQSFPLCLWNKEWKWKGLLIRTSKKKIGQDMSLIFSVCLFWSSVIPEVTPPRSWRVTVRVTMNGHSQGDQTQTRLLPYEILRSRETAFVRTRVGIKSWPKVQHLARQQSQQSIPAEQLQQLNPGRTTTR